MTDGNEQEEPSEAKKPTSRAVGPLIAVGVVAAALLLLFIIGGAEPTTGTIQYEGHSQRPWKIGVDKCYTRRDITPVGGAGGASRSYHARVFTSEKVADTDGLIVIRDVRASFGDNSVVVSRGPKESPTKEDLNGLTKFKAKMWFIQLNVPGAAAPIRITPDMCKRFALDVTNEISKALPRDRDGSVSLDCTTPAGAKVTAEIKYDGCL